MFIFNALVDHSFLCRRQLTKCFVVKHFSSHGLAVSAKRWAFGLFGCNQFIKFRLERGGVLGRAGRAFGSGKRSSVSYLIGRRLFSFGRGQHAQFCFQTTTLKRVQLRCLKGASYLARTHCFCNIARRAALTVSRSNRRLGRCVALADQSAAFLLLTEYLRQLLQAHGVARLPQHGHALLNRRGVSEVDLLRDLLTRCDALQLRVLATQSTANRAAQHVGPTANGVVRLLEGRQLGVLQRLRVSPLLLGLLVRLRRNAEQGLHNFCHVLLLRGTRRGLGCQTQTQFQNWSAYSPLHRHHQTDWPSQT